VAEALPHGEVLALLEAHGRLRAREGELHELGAKTIPRWPPVVFNRF
jgi:hypothetical protein